jgi:hypothetical protein
VSEVLASAEALEVLEMVLGLALESAQVLVQELEKGLVLVQLLAPGLG